LVAATVAAARIPITPLPGLTVGILLDYRDLPEQGTGDDAIVLPYADLSEAAGGRRGDVEGRGAGQYLD
jgi:hypothetical protein